MAEKKINPPEYLVVNATFFYKGNQLFTRGQVIPANHPVVKGRQNLFRPFAPLGAKPEPVPVPVPEPSPKPEPAPEPSPKAGAASGAGDPS